MKLYVLVHFSVKRTPSQLFLYKHWEFFRKDVLKHTSERPHLEDSLALYETAEPNKSISKNV